MAKEETTLASVKISTHEAITKIKDDMGGKHHKQPLYLIYEHAVNHYIDHLNSLKGK